MNRTNAQRLAQLEDRYKQYGPGCGATVEKLLKSLRAATFADAESLVRFHDLLLFLRAFPQSRGVARLADALLASTAQQMRKLRAAGTDMSVLDDEQFSGIVGSAIADTFTYEVARWLAQRYPQQVTLDLDVDEQARLFGVTLPRFVPLLADDSLVEADTPFLEYLANIAGSREQILPWLLQQLETARGTMLEKTAWYDALKLRLSWELGESAASRTHARWGTMTYVHTQPLIRRGEVSLVEELNGAPLQLRKLSRSEGKQALDFTRAALTVRYRELWGTTRGDPDNVVEADVGRGVRIFLWGLPPDRRLPLRAYHAGITIKNGVPINYIEGISLFDWMEVGFNTFYAFRDGETAWVYSKVLHLLHQVAGVTCISVYPYQLGHENEEAIKSGAFWFYRKLGFRPGKPELLALTEREEARMARNAGHRTSARTLRKLAAEHVFLEWRDGPHGQWDSFSVRNIALVVEQRIARDFGGDGEKMRQAASAALAQQLAVRPESLAPLEQSVLTDFASVLALDPSAARWSSEQKMSLLAIIRAKAGRDEASYLRLLQQHAALKQIFLRLGSLPAVQQTLTSRNTKTSL